MGKRWLIYFSCTYCLLMAYDSQAKDFYWVGGSGNWTDLSHWATTSGGSTYHIQVPTSLDDIYFDTNSFSDPTDTVTVNTATAYTKDIFWDPSITGVTLTGPLQHQIKIAGSLRLSPNMNYAFLGNLVFNAVESDIKVIEGQGFILGNTLIFDGPGASWTVPQDFGAAGELWLNDGSLEIQTNAEVSADELKIIPQGNTTMQLDGSLVVAAFININGSNLNFTTGPSSLIDLQGDGAKIRVTSNTELNFNKVIFSNPNGIATVEGKNPTALRCDTLSFSSNANIFGGAQANVINLAPAKTYKWEEGETYAFNEFNAPGTCAAPIHIQSSDQSKETYFTNSGAATSSVNGDFINIRDVHISSGYFEVFNSIDDGNNMGWVLNARPSFDLYWVGDGGNWDDPAHWSLTSGGAGGACIPTAYDNVYFDANSFTIPSQIVDVNIDNAFCKSMSWNGATNNPTIFSDGEQLHIFGDLLLNEMMSFDIDGNVHFEGNRTNVIQSGNQHFNPDVYFNGKGTWTLLDSMEIKGYLYLNEGTLNTNDQTVQVVRILSEEETDFTLILGNSHIVHDRVGPLRGTTWKIKTNSFSLDAGTSTVEFIDNGSISLREQKALAWNRIIFRSRGGINNNQGNIGIAVHRIKKLEFYGISGLTGNMLLDTLFLYPGSSTNSSSSGIKEIEYLSSLGTCDSSIYIQSNSSTEVSEWRTNNILSEISHTYVTNINGTGSGQYQTTTSGDLGGNTNWTFGTTVGRKLFWVGDGGNWSDRTHWSLTSGGPGGECIPSPLDDVIFDENSFSVDNQKVDGGVTYFKDMDWRNIDNSVVWTSPTSYAYGSIWMSEMMTIPYWGGVHLKGNQPDNVLAMKGLGANALYIFAQPDGHWTVIEDAKFGHRTEMRGGGITFEEVNYTSSAFSVVGAGADLFVDLGKATINIFGDQGFNVKITSDPVKWNAGTSHIRMTGSNPKITSSSRIVPLHNVTFTNTSGTGRVAHGQLFNELIFQGNGTIESSITANRLVFTPGHSYILKEGKVQTVNEELVLIGNNCFSIELSSSIDGNKAIIDINNFPVESNFINMKDIRIQNSESNYAGVFSTDIGNSNEGWIFQSRPEASYSGFLGDNEILCPGQPIPINVQLYGTTPSSYLWQDGSTDSVQITNTIGIYAVTVTFANACELIDTMLVEDHDKVSLALGPDTTLCSGDTYLLDVSHIDLPFVWQDGSSADTFNITTPGQYILETSATFCTVRDTVQIAYQASPNLDLGTDQNICAGDSAILDATSIGATYLWNDNSTNSTLNVSVDGTYSVTVSDGRCKSSDTLVLAIKANPMINLGRDSTICEGETLAINLPNSYTYLWNSGSTSANRDLEIGQHIITATLDGCTAEDSISIFSKPLPVFNLGRDTTLCDTEDLGFDFSGIGDSYSWSDGTTNGIKTINAPGNYILTITKNGCTSQDDINIQRKNAQAADLGVDTTLCQGSSLSYSFNDVTISYLWQDGSTNNNYNISNPGEYWLEIDNDGCIARDSVTVAFVAVPSFDLGSDQSLCEGENWDINISLPGANFEWSDGDISSVRSLNQSGMYWLEVENNGCSARDSVELTFNTPPSFSLGPDSTICQGSSVSWNLSGIGDSYTWQDGSSMPNFTADASGLYILAISQNGCTSKDSVEVNIIAPPAINLGNDISLCIGDSVELEALVQAGDNIEWSDGSNDAKMQVMSTGSYWVSVDRDGCMSTDEINISFVQAPQFDLGTDTTLCDDQFIQLNPGIDEAEYLWQDGSTSAALQVERPGRYTVEVSKNGCSTYDFIDIDFRSCNYYRTYIPEVFSPNKDGINDVFEPQFSRDLLVLSYNMQIYDRWGGLIYDSEESSEGWDGTWRGQNVRYGSYLYVIHVDYVDDRGQGNRIERGTVEVWQ